ncbi:hypothetical protein AAMO2058_000599600 [Amorphochlora amoebiformis]
MRKKKKSVKKKKKVVEGKTSLGSVQAYQLNELKAFMRAVRTRSDYISIKVYIANWKFASCKLLMRTSDTFEVLKKELEVKHGVIEGFKLFKDKGSVLPIPGEEIKDLTCTLDDLGYRGATLNPMKQVALPESGMASAVIHCKFDPVIKGALLETDSMIVINGKLQSSIAVTARALNREKKQKSGRREATMYNMK